MCCGGLLPCSVDTSAAAARDQPGPVADEGLLVEHEAEGAAELVGGEAGAVALVIETGKEPAAVLGVGVVAGDLGADVASARHRGDLTGTCDRRKSCRICKDLHPSSEATI